MIKRSRILLVLSFLAVALNSAPAIAPPKTVWPVPDWETATPESQGMSSTKLEALKSYFEEKKTRAALVIRHGKIVGEWYWDNQAKESRFPVYSVTKSFSSTAIGLLQDAGKLKLSQPASDFIPAWKSDGRKDITIRQLVSMTSGLKMEEISYFMSKDQRALTFAQPYAYAPGTHWDYNNLACNALGEIVEKASGSDLDEYLKKALFEPLGMKELSMDKNNGRTLAYMGLRINARDLAKAGYLFLQKGKWQGKRVLSEAWIEAATSPSQELNTGYGYLWWMNSAARGSYSAIGLYGNYLTVYPQQDMIIVRLIGTGSGAATDVNAGKFSELAVGAITDVR